MKTLRETKIKICMLILILLIQVVSPLLTIMVENSFTLTTLGVETTWDVSANGDGSVTAVLDEEGTLTISGSGAMESWYYDDVPWYSIRTSIKKVVIGEGVTSIGGDAFKYCSSLTEITIPEGVTSIGRKAFYKCSSLEEITIPSSVTSIGNYAFYGCSNLEEIKVTEGNKRYISEEGVLYNKDKTKLICYPEGKTDTKFEIPTTVTSIGSGAFYGCSSLEEITIPSSVTSIGWDAFSGCSSLKEITIPSSVTSIGDYAFYGCSSLKEITIPSSVTSIDDYAFYGCSSLTKIEVNEKNEKYISEEGVLYNKDKTKLICYPAGKTDTKFEIPTTVTSIGYYAFYGCSSLEKITIPNSVTSIGKYAFQYCSSLKEITIPSSVTSIGGSAFSGCRSLKEITIPEGVTSIDDYAFSDCSSLEEITIPSSVTSIGRYAFFYCISLEKITIPSSVTSIGSSAFYRANIIKAIAIGEGEIQEIDLPDIIKRAMDEEDILYTEKEFTLTNCSLNEDKTKLIVNAKTVEEKEVNLEVTEGALEGLTVKIVPSRNNNI